MATALHPGSVTTHEIRASAFDQPAYQAYMILYAGFVALPIIAGVDKFFDLLVNWDAYLAPIVTQTLGINAQPFMLVVGVIEIVAGLLVAVRPQIGAYVVGLWLLGIIVNLLLLGGEWLELAHRRRKQSALYHGRNAPRIEERHQRFPHPQFPDHLLDIKFGVRSERLCSRLHRLLIARSERAQSVLDSIPKLPQDPVRNIKRVLADEINAHAF